MKNGKCLKRFIAKWYNRI